MPVLNRAADMKDEIAAIRRELHQNPQTAYEETFASDMVATKLGEWGIEFKRGYAKTGIVATIHGQKKTSGTAIALRADMDALDIVEKSGQPWASKTPGKMHGCGHDGHTAILLGTAKYLQETKNFDGTVHLIFQPAEEGAHGADRMIEDGVFKDFPCDAIYGLHNWPNIPLGRMETRAGALLANVDEFEITITGKGGHAAMPENTIDPAICAAHLVTALQTIVSRNSSPVDPLVISVTNINIGTGAFNVISDSAKLTGTVRSFSDAMQNLANTRIKEICTGIGATFGADISLSAYKFGTKATINSEAETLFAASCAAKVLGDANVSTSTPLCMGGEDFGAFLKVKPGAYVFMGQGTKEPSPHNQGLHSPFYDFNDDLIPIGISYFTALVENAMKLDT